MPLNINATPPSGISASDMTSAMAGKMNANPGGSTSEYVRGEGSLATFPTIPSATSQLSNDTGFINGSTLVSALSPYAQTSTVNTGLAGKSDTGHTHTASQISDSTTVGRGVLTAADAASARAAIGAGTSSAAGTVTQVTAGTGLSGGAITTSGTVSMPNTGSAGTYSGVTTDAQGRVSAGTNRSITGATRSINSAFQVSSTRDAIVSYTVDIACTLSITGGQVGTVTLEYADDSGISTNVVSVASTVNGNSGTLTIGLAITQTASAAVSGYIPIGKYVRIRTTNTTSTPNFTYRSANEVLL